MKIFTLWKYCVLFRKFFHYNLLYFHLITSIVSQCPVIAVPFVIVIAVAATSASLPLERAFPPLLGSFRPSPPCWRFLFLFLCALWLPSCSAWTCVVSFAFGLLALACPCFVRVCQGSSSGFPVFRLFLSFFPLPFVILFAGLAALSLLCVHLNRNQITMKTSATWL